MATTVYSTTLVTNNTGWENLTAVNYVTPLLAGGLDQIRFHFTGHTALGCKILRASHSILSGTAWVSTATPTEITFNAGGHGFTIGGSDSIWSDWMTLAGSASAGLTSGDTLFIKTSYAATDGNVQVKTGVTGCHLATKGGDLVLDADSSAGLSYVGEWNLFVDLIETQSVAGGGSGTIGRLLDSRLVRGAS